MRLPPQVIELASMKSSLFLPCVKLIDNTDSGLRGSGLKSGL